MFSAPTAPASFLDVGCELAAIFACRSYKHGLCPGTVEFVENECRRVQERSDCGDRGVAGKVRCWKFWTRVQVSLCRIAADVRSAQVCVRALPRFAFGLGFVMLIGEMRIDGVPGWF